MSTVGLVASIVLGLVFVVSGGSKIAAGPGWPEQARGLGAPAIVVPVLPWVEIVLGALLVTQVVPIAAAFFAIVLLAAFTVLISLRLIEGRHPPCACFGAWSSKPLGAGHIARNVVFMALGVLALLA